MYVDIACRSVLVAVFAVAVLSKVRSASAYRDFATSLRPLGATRMAPVVVGTELLVVTLLLVHRAPTGYVAAAALMVLFILGITRSLHREVPVSCRCFGSRGGQLGWRHVVRNVLLLMVSLAGWSTSSAPWPASTSAAALAVGSGLLLSLLFIGWDELAFLAGVDDRAASSR